MGLTSSPFPHWKINFGLIVKENIQFPADSVFRKSFNHTIRDSLSPQSVSERRNCANPVIFSIRINTESRDFEYWPFLSLAHKSPPAYLRDGRIRIKISLGLFPSPKNRDHLSLTHTFSSSPSLFHMHTCGYKQNILDTYIFTDI